MTILSAINKKALTQNLMKLMKTFCIILLMLQISFGFRKAYERRYQPVFFSKAAVVTNSFECTNIALDILKCGGSAADAAIAALLCEGISNPQSMGIGGGFILTIYNKKKGYAEVLNARESAPKCANKNMFGPLTNKDIGIGGKAVAVPGELKGYWELHKKYGKMKWQDLFIPTIQLLKRGVYVSMYLASVIAKLKKEIMNSLSIKAIFLNRETGKLYEEGETMCRPKLVETLEKVAQHGPDYLYNGPLTKQFVQDISDQGGIMYKEDLKKYKPRWMKALVSELPNNLVAYTAPSPAAGAPLLIILDVISKILNNGTPLIFWHRIIEAWKFAYGLKSQQTGPTLTNKQLPNCYYNHSLTSYIRGKIDDARTFNDAKYYFGVFDDTLDFGTAHISILAPNGDAVSVTSTINLSFGALFASPSTGIILNNQMLDFAIPCHHPARVNPANYIKPFKQPVSSMCPTVIINILDGSVQMVVGSSGGYKILSSTSLVIIRHLWFYESLADAIVEPRLHHQLLPNVIEYEPNFPKDILHGLRRKGHVLKKFKSRLRFINSTADIPVNSAVNAIVVENGEISAVGDRRRNGYADGF